MSYKLDASAVSTTAISSICLLLAVSCAPGDAISVEKGGVITSTRLVAVQNITASPKLMAAKKDRVKISSLTIDAPRKGSLLASNRLSGVYRSRSLPDYRVNRISEFRLKNDAEEPLRNALNYYFDLDATSSKSALVSALMRTSSARTSSFTCETFSTVTMVVLNVTMRGAGGIEDERTYVSEFPADFCGVSMFMYYLEPEKFSNSLRNAMELVIEKMTGNLGASM